MMNGHEYLQNAFTCYDVGGSCSDEEYGELSTSDIVSIEEYLTDVYHLKIIDYLHNKYKFNFKEYDTKDYKPIIIKGILYFHNAGKLYISQCEHLEQNLVKVYIKIHKDFYMFRKL